MQCLILVGGLGTRMQAVGGGTPKALLKAGSNTFIDWQLQFLNLLGVSDVVLALAHEAKLIEDHIEKQKKTLKFPKINYSYDGPKLLGTGGAIKKAKALLEKDFMVIYGDSFLLIDLEDFKKKHFEEGKPLTLSIYKNKNQGDKSNVVFKNGQILKYDKKNHSEEMEYIDYGLSYVNKDYFFENTPEGHFDFATFISSTVEKKMGNAYEARQMFYEIGSPQGYKDFLKLISENNFSLEKLLTQCVSKR